MSDLYFAVTMLLALGLTIGLWVAAWRFERRRRFWSLLAAAWSLGLAGNVAWGLAFPPGSDLPSFSWLDLFYLARYLAVGAAIGLHLRDKFPATMLTAVGLTALASALAWLAVRPIFWSAAASCWDWLAGLSMYPLLDVALWTLAVRLWVALEAGAFKAALAWLTGGLLAYGAANLDQLVCAAG